MTPRERRTLGMLSRWPFGQLRLQATRSSNPLANCGALGGWISPLPAYSASAPGSLYAPASSTVAGCCRLTGVRIRRDDAQERFLETVSLRRILSRL